MDLGLRERVCVVTGSTAGIGLEVARLLAEEGARVVTSGRSEAPKVGEELHVTGDLSIPGEPERVVEAVLADWGRVDILVNNAGVIRDKLFLQMEADDWNVVIGTNLTGAFGFCKAVAKQMAFKQRAGRIINVSSIVGRIGNFGQSNYAAAKAGLIGLTKSLAREYASKGVTVNAIAPGFVRTRMLEGVPDKVMQSVLALTPVGRLGEPMEIAASVLYLASPAAGFVTGHVLDVNGGMAM